MRSKWIIASLLTANIMGCFILCIKNNAINKVKQRITSLYHEKKVIIDRVYILRNHDAYLLDLSDKYESLEALSYDIPDIRSLSQILSKELNIAFDSTELQKVYELSPKLCIDRLQYFLRLDYFRRGYDIGLYFTSYIGIKENGKSPYLVVHFSPYEAILSINGKNYWWSARSIWNNEKLKISKADFKNLKDATCYIKVNAIAEKLLESKIVWVKDIAQ
jgi:hypothetical protein